MARSDEDGPTKHTPCEVAKCRHWWRVSWRTWTWPVFFGAPRDRAEVEAWAFHRGVEGAQLEPLDAAPA